MGSVEPFLVGLKGRIVLGILGFAVGLFAFGSTAGPTDDYRWATVVTDNWIREGGGFVQPSAGCPAFIAAYRMITLNEKFDRQMAFCSGEPLPDVGDRICASIPRSLHRDRSGEFDGTIRIKWVPDAFCGFDPKQ
jgi:hypothetical protein